MHARAFVAIQEHLATWRSGELPITLRTQLPGEDAQDRDYYLRIRLHPDRPADAPEMCDVVWIWRDRASGVFDEHPAELWIDRGNLHSNGRLDPITLARLAVLLDPERATPIASAEWDHVVSDHESQLGFRPENTLHRHHNGGA